jgi:hypothetical protein
VIGFAGSSERLLTVINAGPWCVGLNVTRFIDTAAARMIPTDGNGQQRVGAQRRALIRRTLLLLCGGQPSGDDNEAEKRQRST